MIELFVRMLGTSDDYPLPIWGLIGLHGLWAIAILIGSDANGTTALSGLLAVIHDPIILSISLIAASLSAIYALTGEHDNYTRLLLLIPQQLIATVVAANAIYYMVLGHFADGVQRTSLFLVVDQSPTVIFMLIYTIAVIRRARTG